MSFDKILCPVDFSECARRALHKAMAIAREGRATVTILHVIDLQSATPEAPAIQPELYARLAEAAQLALADWQADAKRVLPGVEVEVALSEGRAWERIVSFARDRAHDLVILGTHGRTAAENLPLGTVAERVASFAPCSVLLVRDRAASSSLLRRA